MIHNTKKPPVRGGAGTRDEPLRSKNLCVGGYHHFRLCCREAGEREKESARGMMGRGKKEERPFPNLRSGVIIIIFLLLRLEGMIAG